LEPDRARLAGRTPEAPLITIAVPAYNRPALLAEALASVARQTVRLPIEVVVCDDGLMEQTKAAVSQYARGRYFYLPNETPMGAVGNWNRCLRAARGEFVMVLHEDDALYPWYLESVLPLMREGVVAACMRTARGAVQPFLPRPAPAAAVAYPPGFFLKSSMTPFPGVLMRRDVALSLGGFDEAWGPVADYEFWYRLSLAGRIEVVEAVGAFYRVGPSQWTERVWARMLSLTHLLRLRIAREQFPKAPRLGRWMARFFTYRNARHYRERFGDGAAALRRGLRMRRIAFSFVPSGWVWQALRFASRKKDRHARIAPYARGTPQIQQGGRGPDRVAA
jgi:glycosyltransferase involved in cell wall biosynthesis